MSRASALLLLVLSARPALAVGLDGAGSASSRLVASAGAGWDHVGGYGRDGFAFTEVAVSGEMRVWRRLTLGVAATGRWDVTSYNFALERFRDGGTGVAATAFIGYDGPSFHFDVGPWLYGDDRDGRGFRAGVSPWGSMRLRAGNLDRWHFTLRVLGDAPFTAAGATTGVRAEVGAPPSTGPRRHRMKAGAYTSAGESTIGLSFSDELVVQDATWRAGVLLGTDYGHFGSRPELMAFAGRVW